MRRNVAPGRRHDFQKPVARIELGMSRALYVGPTFGGGEHGAGVTCLAIPVGGTMRVQVNGKALAESVDSALLTPGVRFRLTPTTGSIALLYVDPNDGLTRSLESEMTRRSRPGVRFEHARAGLLAERLAAGEGLAVFGPPMASRTDPRIARLFRAWPDEAFATGSVPEAAAALGLSPSRFMHVFRDHVGVSFRRYRLWARLRIAMRAVAGGRSLTRAAHDAAFASSSHLSDSFRRAFGVKPSSLAGIRIEAARRASS
jgi:AraC-like DNA-binding protein